VRFRGRPPPSQRIEQNRGKTDENSHTGDGTCTWGFGWEKASPSICNPKEEEAERTSVLTI